LAKDSGMVLPVTEDVSAGAAPPSKYTLRSSFFQDAKARTSNKAELKYFNIFFIRNRLKLIACILNQVSVCIHIT
jgi:hypothetical protein